mmetsp:Transcript_33890/g.39128  ORF Transcript_33890/g.39128 Transcript_33890/m.39128 type:complete len:87 (+) Transcript_33890:86-346(+)
MRKYRGFMHDYVPGYEKVENLLSDVFKEDERLNEYIAEKQKSTLIERHIRTIKLFAIIFSLFLAMIFIDELFNGEGNANSLMIMKL